jgi:Leucine-rich repeat (LRR) protein
LESLPNKPNLKKLNFFGNQIQEIDFTWLLSTFPNLESLNIENNPVKVKNLNNLTSEQFSKLVNGIKEKKFRVISWQGTYFNGPTRNTPSS